MRKLFLIFAYLILCTGCSPPPEQKPIILVSIPPYADLIKKIVADEASIQIFAPPGSNPHVYEPSPEQVHQFTQAKIWFRTGDPIERKIVQFLKPYNVQMVDLSHNKAVLDTECHAHHHDHEEKDLHLWLSPLIVAEQVEEITRVLIESFPNLKQSFEENSKALIDRLKQLDAHISQKLAPFKGSRLLISHPSLAYFCERYGLHQLSIEVEGKDPLLRDIASLMDELKEHPIPVVFTQPQYNNKGALLIADQLHLPSQEIDPYAEDYFEMLELVTEAIVTHY